MLSVKPQIMDEVLEEIAPHLNGQLLVSIAAGYPIERMEAIVGKDRRIVRVMPNTPSKVGAGASPYALNKNATEDDSKAMEQLLGSVGVAMEVRED
jgi:pyrroline-5-carboxylate reductase